MTSDHMKDSKGLEFPVVALPGVGRSIPRAKGTTGPAGALCGGDKGYVGTGDGGGGRGFGLKFPTS